MSPDEAKLILEKAPIRYNDRLATDILAGLKAFFPIATSGSHLKSQNPKFANSTSEEWLLTLDGLSKLGFVRGTEIRAGFSSKLREIINLEITNEGLAALQKTLQTPSSYYWALSQEFGRASWKRWAARVAAATVAASVS